MKLVCTRFQDLLQLACVSRVGCLNHFCKLLLHLKDFLHAFLRVAPITTIWSA